MKVEVEIPDRVLEEAVQQRVKQTLAPNGERAIVVSPDARRQLEALFETTVESEADLVKYTRKLCLWKIDAVEFTFTADELARIDMQAKFHGRTRNQFINEMVIEIKGRMLEQV